MDDEAQEATVETPFQGPEESGRSMSANQWWFMVQTVRETLCLGRE